MHFKRTLVRALSCSRRSCLQDSHYLDGTSVSALCQASRNIQCAVQIYSASSDGSVRVWDTKTCECLANFKCASYTDKWCCDSQVHYRDVRGRTDDHASIDDLMHTQHHLTSSKLARYLGT